MEERRARRIDLTVVQMPEDGGGSRPKPPKAGARSVRLEPNPASGNHQKAERPLTAKTVAQPSNMRRTERLWMLSYTLATKSILYAQR